MRKFTLLIVGTLLSVFTYGQLSGPKTIPGDYATIALAIADLNAVGVAPPGVTFTIASGYTETFASPTAGLITATGTTPNDQIIFQATTGGTRPVITAATGTSTVDGIIVIHGGNYITFDGIDLQENPANTTTTMQMEWGYALVKVDGTNGAQNNTIKNCTVTLNKTNTSSAGIYFGNHTDLVTTALTVTNATGTNSNNKVNGNTVSNAFTPIYISGFNDVTAPYAFYDQNNEIGFTTGNTVYNFGGASTSYGIYLRNNNNAKICNNNIGNLGSTSTLRGIYLAGSTNANVDVLNNTIALSSAATGSQLTGIESAITGTTNIININNNIIQSCAYPTATTGTFYAIYNNAAAFTVNINGNTITNNTMAGTGIFYGIETGSPNTANVNNNNINNNGRTGIGTIYCIKMTSPTNITINGNTIEQNNQNAPASTGSTYGVYGLSSSVNVTVTNNIIRNMSVTGTGSIYGVREFGVAGNKFYQNNQIYGFSSPGGGSFYGIYASTGIIDISGNQIYGFSATGGTAGVAYGIYVSGGTTNNIYKNKVYNLSLSSTGPTLYGFFISGGTTNNIYNNYISDLKTPLANAANPLAGIYVSGGTTDNIFYNTVYLNAVSTGALFGSTGIYTSTTPTFDLRNNIVVNTSTPVGATGFTVCYRRSGAILTSYSANSNNNNFYAGTPGTNNLIFYNGINADQTILDYQTRVAPRDAVSFTENPPFVNIATTPYDLHIQTTISTKCESGGVKITAPAITDDFDGIVRWGEAGYTGAGSATDVGADEFEGIPSFTCVAPTPGNTIASLNPVCLGQPVTLSLQNATTGTGVSFQWQNSSDGITYSNVAGANSSTYFTTPTSAIYYQCIVTCQNGPSTATSTPVHLTFANSVTSTTPGSRCGTGSVVLNAVGSAGTTLNWYDALTAGNNVGTGSPFNTPSISATTTFYVGAETFSPVNVTLGAGASTSTGYETPFNHLWGGMKAQYLIRASELTAAGLSAGNITSLGIDIAAPGTTYNTFNLSVGTTALTALTTTLQTGLTNVYSAVSITPVLGINTIVFATPFNWDGVSNIIIESCWSNNNTGGTSSTVKYDAVGFVAESYYRNDSQDAATLCGTTTATSTLSARPKFILAGIGTCSSPREAVVATIGSSPALILSPDQNVCNGAIGTIAVTSTLSDYNTYVWTPVTDLYTDAAATVPYIGGASASTVYVKSIIAGPVTYTCTANNTTTLCSNVTTTVVTVQDVVPIPTSTTSPVSVCMAALSAMVDASASSLPVTTSYSFGLNLQSPGPATPFTITIPALPAGAIVTGTTLEIIGANAINGSYRNEIRVALSGISTLAATSISTLGSGGLITPDPSITVPNIPATGGSLTLTLSESYDDGGAGTTDATFAEIKLNVTYTIPLPISWYSAATAGTLLGNGSPFETVGTSVLPNTNTPGTYHFYAQATAGACVSPSRLDFSVIVNPVLVALTPVDVTCNGGNDGSFTLGTVSCGAAPFTYSIDGGAFGAIPTDLAAGSYTIIAKDNGGNNSGAMTLVIGEPSWTVPVATGSPVSACLNATTAIISVTPGSVALPQTITVPFDITVQPTETNAAPGNIIATATLPAIPAGATVTSAVLTYNGITALGGSWQADVNLGFDGSIIDPAASGTGALNGAGIFNYIRNIPTASIDLAGGSLNLLYWDAYNDNTTGDESTFPTGVGVATLTITYNPGSGIAWYDAASGGSLLGSNVTLETVGTSVLPNTTTPGTYNFYAEGNYSGCTSASRTLVTVTINPLPTISLTSPSAVTICEGGNTDITMNLTGTAPWTWIGDDGSGPATFNVTSSPFTTNVAPTVTTTYSLLSVTDANGCSNTSTESVTVTVDPASVAGTATATDAAVCSGSGTTINVTGSTGNIQWQSSADGTTWADIIGETNAALTTGNLTANTYYQAVVTSGVCSSATSNSEMVTVNPLPTMVLTSSPAVSICLGENTDITFDLTGTAPWTWVGDDGTSQGTFNETATPATSNVAPITTTTYSVVSITDATGCSNTSTASVVVTVNIPAVVTITENNNILSSDATSGNQWYEQVGGIITGETNQNYTPTADGNYYVIVTDINGCTSMSNVISFVLSTSNITMNSGLNIYPNPASGKVFVEVSSNNNSMTTIELMTMDGRILYESSTEASGKVTMSINLDEYASGVYMIKAVSDNKTMIQKLVIQ